MADLYNAPQLLNYYCLNECPIGCRQSLSDKVLSIERVTVIHDRAERGCGYSIDERDMKVYQGWKRNRRRRGIDPDWPTEEERDKL